MKICSKCKVEKPLTDFTKDLRSRDKVRCWCKNCHYEAGKRWILKNPERHRDRVYKAKLKAEYNITLEEKEGMLAAQKSGCACCGDPLLSSRNSHVDHLHGSDPVVIRGILCPQCNIGLGYFKDSPERLIKAAEYLKKFQKSS